MTCNKCCMYKRIMSIALCLHFLSDMPSHLKKWEINFRLFNCVFLFIFVYLKTPGGSIFMVRVSRAVTSQVRLSGVFFLLKVNFRTYKHSLMPLCLMIYLARSKSGKTGLKLF